MTGVARCINAMFDPAGHRWSYTLQVTDPAPAEGKQPTYLALSSDTEVAFLVPGHDYDVALTNRTEPA